MTHDELVMDGNARGYVVTQDDGSNCIEARFIQGGDHRAFGIMLTGDPSIDERRREQLARLLRNEMRGMS